MNPGDLVLDDLPLAGTGPVATVHVVRRTDGTHGALKVFPQPMDRFTRTALDRERKALGTLTHVSAILQADTVEELPDGRTGLCMELCEQSLGQLLEACGTLTLPDVTAIGQAVATALAAAHEAGVVHGAVTPHNVLLRADGEPVLADFGLALRRRYPQDPGPWAAPETLRDNTFSEQTDLYGLGAVLVTALTGSPSGEQADLPEPLRELLGSLLAEDPADRPVDAATVLAELTGQPVPETAAPDPVPGDFDDFPEDVDRGSAQQVEDEFFAEWEGKAPPAATDDERAPRSPHGRAVGVAAALAVLVAVPVLARRQPPAAVDTAPQQGFVAADATAGFTVRSTRAIEFTLDPPVDQGSMVTLTWHSDTDLDYAVVIAGASVPTRVVRVAPGRHTLRVPVDRDRRYCFLVQGTDGEQAYETAPRPIRRAVCGQ